ncbi:hypothetical protein PAXRUDRAFT_96878, partial [Paxillus rubicundulus Ve08.2h10]
VMSVTINPNHSKLNFVQAVELYLLPDFLPMLKEYICWCSNNSDIVRTLETFNILNVWYEFHVQQYSSSQASIIMPSQAVQASLPSAMFPFGNCDAVLLDTDGQS